MRHIFFVVIICCMWWLFCATSCEYDYWYEERVEPPKREGIIRFNNLTSDSVRVACVEDSDTILNVSILFELDSLFIPYYKEIGPYESASIGLLFVRNVDSYFKILILKNSTISAASKEDIIKDVILDKFICLKYDSIKSIGYEITYTND